MNAEEFYNAARGGRLDLVKQYLQEGGHVDDYGSNSQWTALCGAAYNGHSDIICFLLDQGASPFLISQAKTPREWAQHASRSGDAETLKKAEFAYIVRTTPEWSLFGTSKLAHVEFSLPLNRKLTEIFNFESRQHLTIYENMLTGEEKMLPLASLDTLGDKMIEKTFSIFESLGGKADPDIVFQRTTFKKSGLTPKG